MIPEKVKDVLKKQHYGLVGKHSAVQVCRWTKKSMRDEGICYKEQFYGIESHRCCQMTPAVMWCPNKCLHCWRAVELTVGDKLGKDIDSPKEIIDGCIEAQKKLIVGFKKSTVKKNLSRANMEKWEEAQEPMQFAISLSGEPFVYDKIGGLIEELRKRGKTSFVVTNGLYPEKIKELAKKKQLPTQLYISVNTPNKEMYENFHRSTMKDAWKKLNESLEIMSSLKCRTIVRINLVKDLNMHGIKEYAELVKKANPLFVEIKAFMSVGFARQRLEYERMPYHKDVREFAEKLTKETGLKILDEKEESRVVLLGKSKKDMKIKENEF